MCYTHLGFTHFGLTVLLALIVAKVAFGVLRKPMVTTTYLRSSKSSITLSNIYI